MKFKKGETVIYPQHGACIVQGTQKKTMFGETKEYLVLRSVIGEMTLSVPLDKTEEVGVRPPVSADELEDLVSVLSKPDPRVPSNWSRRFKNHQEKLKSGDVYQVAEVVRNLAARNRDAALSAAERTMYERARINLVSEIAPALKVERGVGRAVPRRCPGQGRAAAAQGGLGSGQEGRLSAVRSRTVRVRAPWPARPPPRAPTTRRLPALLDLLRRRPGQGQSRW